MGDCICLSGYGGMQRTGRADQVPVCLYADTHVYTNLIHIYWYISYCLLACLFACLFVWLFVGWLVCWLVLICLVFLYVSLG